MNEVDVQIGNATASPTKDFFVKMLTRDIDLQDAILDLLDNCVDGIIRSSNYKSTSNLPYDGFFAEIILDKDQFQIRDNCGGISFEVAENYAFAMGRPPAATVPAGAATVGMYGIGMKRAIFKLGTTALVESRADRGFVVEITSDWMEDNTWSDLPMRALSDDTLPQGGTSVEVLELYPEVAANFSNPTWIDDFRKTIATHYSLIIAKGFKVRVGTKDQINSNCEPITPEKFRLLQTSETEKAASQEIQPYMYIGKIDDVHVEVFVGLYRKLMSSDEAEEEEETRGSSDDAGWTIACNDRVVVWKDKSRLTGWGEASVPIYHGQFIAITGIVLLTSDDPKKLPLTTTKRGIDASSNVFLAVKDLMRGATKSLTSFTNKWKKFPDQLEAIYKDTKYVELTDLRASVPTIAMSSSRKLRDIRKFEPTYPIPAQEKTSVRVNFVALKADVQRLSSYYFDTAKAKPGEVGEYAFNRELSKLKSISR